MSVRRIFASLALVLLIAAVAAAQTTPTGTLTGKVVDPDGLVLPGVTVTATSPSLQGTRTATTSANGDYIIPFLPAGEYKVVFELAGFPAGADDPAPGGGDGPAERPAVARRHHRDGDRDGRVAARLHEVGHGRLQLPSRT